MENTARLLRVQKKIDKHMSNTKRHGGRKLPLLKKLATYLNCDTFMYAPLFSPDFPSPDDTFSSSAKVVELRKPRKENQQRFVEQVEDYLKSDVYMYAPLLVSPHSSPEPSQNCKTKMLTTNLNQQTDHDGNLTKRSESQLQQTDISGEHSPGHRETVKHTVYQTCRSASATRVVTLNSPRRAHS